MLKNVPEENRAELTLAIIVASSLIGGLPFNGGTSLVLDPGHLSDHAPMIAKVQFDVQTFSHQSCLFRPVCDQPLRIPTPPMT